MKRLLRVMLVVLLLALLLCLPALAGGAYYTNLASQVLIAALFAMSLNLLVGYAGLTSLGHAGYLGLSAYTCLSGIYRASIALRWVACSLFLLPDFR